jgi:uncharacterized protein YndB with AHSA1/START domain
MARAYASIILKAPVETVWSIVRDFNALPKWTGGGVTTSMIEKGLDADVVGCVRAFHLANGVLVRERLLMPTWSAASAISGSPTAPRCASAC